MRKKEFRKIMGNLRKNSRKALKKITDGMESKQAKKTILPKRGSAVRKILSIPDFQAIGFPLIIVYKIEAMGQPVKSIQDLHVNNCYKINGKCKYIIEAIFSDALEVENYEDIVRNESEYFTKHYVVEDLVREGFVPK